MDRLKSAVALWGVRATKDFRNEVKRLMETDDDYVIYVILDDICKEFLDVDNSEELDFDEYQYLIEQVQIAVGYHD